jgi:putative lipoprotein
MTISTLTGAVTYRTREGVPAVTLVVALQDVSLQDAEATLVASTTRAVPAGGSLKYSLEYDAAVLKPSHTYSLSARLYLGTTLYKVSDTHLTLSLPETTSADIEVITVPMGCIDLRGLEANESLPDGDLLDNK